MERGEEGDYRDDITCMVVRVNPLIMLRRTWRIRRQRLMNWSTRLGTGNGPPTEKSVPARRPFY